MELQSCSAAALPHVGLTCMSLAATSHLSAKPERNMMGKQQDAPYMDVLTRRR